MTFPDRYKALPNFTQLSHEGFTIQPIRFEHRNDIRQWRNAQVFHLRQKQPLSETQQERYFTNVVGPLFLEDKPSQLLFSFFHHQEFVGYGGLVHIDWEDKRAEVSFVMKTSQQEFHFEHYWTTFAKLLSSVAFLHLSLHKIFTYAYDIRPQLYNALEKAHFTREATLKDHCCVEGVYHNVVFHRLLKMEHPLHPASENDIDLFFNWANDPTTRQNALHSDPIPYEQHVKWFRSKLGAEGTHIFVLTVGVSKIGQIRFDKTSEGYEIDYAVGALYRGQGWGTVLLTSGIRKLRDISPSTTLIGKVKKDNIGSCRVFEKCGFNKGTCTHETGLALMKYTLPS